MMMKKTIVVILAVLAYCFISTLAGAKAQEFGQVTGDEVNMRAAAGTDSEIVRKLMMGTQVEVLDKQGEWYKIIVGEDVGYIKYNYVFLNSQTNRLAFVSEDGVKLRGGPTADSYVITQMLGGHGLKIRHVAGEWYFVDYEGKSGYVHRDYISLTSAKGPAGTQMLKQGMEGEEVKKMQKELQRRGFLASGNVNGVFGSTTKKALSDFQKAANLDPADGIAGSKTLEVLYNPANNIKKTIAMKVAAKGKVKLLDWFKGGAEAFPKGAKATVIDVKTGKSFNVRRFGGWYHADSEPLTAKDTAVFKSIVGKWTWDRRAIWVKIGGTYIAASMNCMPHLVSPTASNNFPGHFCIHFYKSKVHENSKECPRHQACVQAAYKAGK